MSLKFSVVSDVCTINPPSASLYLQYSQSYCRHKVTLQSLPINFPGLDKFLHSNVEEAFFIEKLLRNLTSE
jgi:hypothetical protein